MRIERWSLALTVATLLAGPLRADDGGAAPDTAPVVEDGPLSAGRFTVGVPLEVHVIGFAAGPHPELLWRPFGRDGVTHVVVGVGVQPGSEYLFVPVDVGVRWRFAPAWFFQPYVGVGLQGQTFFVDGAAPFFRPAVTAELGTAVALNDVAAVGVGVTPSLAPLGVPGPGLAARLTVTLELEGMLAGR